MGLWSGKDLDFDQALFLLSSLPRVNMAMLVGAGMGLAGAMLQEVTQNRLVAPTTLGTAAGAWLALVLTALFGPTIYTDYGIWTSMFGALGTTALVLGISGLRQMDGVSVIIIGMAASILFGGIALAMRQSKPVWP